MSPTDTLLVAGDGEAVAAAVVRCNAEGIDTASTIMAAGAWEPIETIAGSTAAAVEKQPSGWVLYLRAGEFLTRGLITELKRELSSETPRAYAFRLRRRLFEGPAPLVLDDPLSRDGEIRLLYRKRARYRGDGSLVSSGTVLRLAEPIHVDVHRSGMVKTRGDSARIGGLPLLLSRPGLLFHPPSASFVMRHPEEVRSWLDGRLRGRAPERR